MLLVSWFGGCCVVFWVGGWRGVGCMLSVGWLVWCSVAWFLRWLVGWRCGWVGECCWLVLGVGGGEKGMLLRVVV